MHIMSFLGIFIKTIYVKHLFFLDSYTDISKFLRAFKGELHYTMSNQCFPTVSHKSILFNDIKKCPGISPENQNDCLLFALSSKLYSFRKHKKVIVLNTYLFDCLVRMLLSNQSLSCLHVCLRLRVELSSILK